MKKYLGILSAFVLTFILTGCVRYNTTVDQIKRLNNLTSNLISINQKLIIPE